MNGTRKTARPLSADALARAAHTLRVLAHGQRLALVDLLDREGECPVRELTRRTGLTQAMTSQHLTRLRHVGVVVARRRGKEMWYSIGDRRCVAVLGCIRNKTRRSR